MSTFKEVHEELNISGGYYLAASHPDMPMRVLPINRLQIDRATRKLKREGIDATSTDSLLAAMCARLANLPWSGGPCTAQIRARRREDNRPLVRKSRPPRPESPTTRRRREMLQMIAANPDFTPAQIAELTGFAVKTVRNNRAKMRRAND